MITFDKKTDIQLIIDSIMRIDINDFPKRTVIIIDYLNDKAYTKEEVLKTDLILGQHAILQSDLSIDDENIKQLFIEDIIKNSIKEKQLKIYTKECINEFNYSDLIAGMIERWAIKKIDRNSQYFEDSKRYSNIDHLPIPFDWNNKFYSGYIPDDCFYLKLESFIIEKRSEIILSDDICYLFNKRIVEACLKDLFPNLDPFHRRLMVNKVSYDFYDDNNDDLIDYDRAKELFNII